MSKTRSCSLPVLVGAALLIVLTPGCSKNKPQAAAPVDVATNAPVAAETGPATPQPAPAQPAQLNFKPIQNMVQQKDYDQAAQQMIMLQRTFKDPTPDQSLAMANQMHLLQRQLAGAAASGDPKAKAAIQKLTAGMSGQ